MCPCRFEAGGQGQHSIQKIPVLKGTLFSRTEAVGWIECVTAALDCYNWVLKEQLFSPSELFDGKYLYTVPWFGGSFSSLMWKPIMCLLP